MRIRNLLGALLASCAFAAVAAIPATEQITAVEFYHSGLDHYVIIATPSEIADLDTGVHPGWVRTGYQFPAFKAGSAYAGTSPVCRFYAPVISSHFYSAKPSECDDVKTKFADAWTFESAEVFRAIVVDPNTGICPTDTTPVYRLWNDRADVNHRYSDQIAVFQFMVGKGYKPEGDGSPALPVAYCTPAGGSLVPDPSASAPNCTVTASSGAPALAATLTLNATCTNSPTGYLWSGCSSSTATCTLSQTTPGTKSYTLYASNAKGPGKPVTISVNWGGGGGGGGVLPICTISASSATLTVGSPLTLSANCSQTPNRYDWMECSYLTQAICNIMPVCAATSATCVVNSSVVGYALYAIAAGNSAGTGPRAGVDVEWTGGGGGGPGPSPIPICTVSSNVASPLINTQVTLTASCSGNPTYYSWSPVPCSGTQCSATSPTPGTITYSVTAGNASGSSTAYVAVNWQGQAPSPTPACTLTASNTAPLIGQTITITSSCTNSPTSYAWTGCASTATNCTDSVAVATIKTYSLVASNGSGAGSPASVVVNWTAPPTSPPTCSVSASNSSPTVGTNVTLTASCNGAPTSYVWTNCASTSSTCVATAAAAGAVTYGVAGVNSFGTGNVANVLVNWQSAGSGGTNFCGSYTNVVQTSVSWGDNSRMLTASMGGFKANGVIVVQFTVPSSPAGYTVAGNTSMAEYGEPATSRHMTLSKSACDFRTADSSGNNGPFAESYGTTVLIAWNVGSQPAALVPGQTYYFNFRNYYGGLGVSCFSTTCNASVQTNWPK